jgi:hypothetical protein
MRTGPCCSHSYGSLWLPEKQAELHSRLLHSRLAPCPSGRVQSWERLWGRLAVAACRPARQVPQRMLHPDQHSLRMHISHLLFASVCRAWLTRSELSRCVPLHTPHPCSIVSCYRGCSLGSIFFNRRPCPRGLCTSTLKHRGTVQGRHSRCILAHCLALLTGLAHCPC